MSLAYLIYVPLIAIVLLAILGKLKTIREIVSVVASAWILIVLWSLYGKNVSVQIGALYGHKLILKMDMLRWFFLIISYGAGLLTMIFSWEFYKEKDNLAYYYSVYFMKILGLGGVFMANDLLTFFIFWEIMSFGTYFMMIARGGVAVKSSYRYITIAVFGAMLFLMGIISLDARFGTLAFDKLPALLMATSWKYQLFILFSFLTVFFVKGSIMPLHYWLPDAYGDAPTMFTTYLATVSARLGFYGVLVYLFMVLGGLKALDKIFYVKYYFNLRYILAWFAGITMVIPTFTALMQNDSKKLMTWHGIGQGGYMLLGVLIGTSLGFAGGLFHVLNYSVYILLIFLGVSAVEYRIGTTNLNKMGGLIHKMPISFLAVLMGIIGLAGMPPLNGFVSKWMIYKAAIDVKWPFLALMAIVGTVGTIMSVYKYIHNIFLGQLPEEYNDVKEAPLFMTIPMVVLMIIEWMLGMFPGIAMKIIAPIEGALGITPIKYSMTGFQLPSGSLNMVHLNMFLGIGMALGACLFFFWGRKHVYVNQYNNYAAGHFLNKNIPYNFNYHFYAAFERMMLPVRKQIINRTVKATAGGIRNVGDIVRGLFSGNIHAYVFYIVVLMVIIIYNI
jgi:formate hydrogenlyase subunit 3/multisubunit Na+/H+ antiporter MnhD subunit